MYIAIEDMKSMVRDSRLTKLIDADTSVFESAASEAEGYVKNSLYQHYDTNTVFNRSGADRDHIVVLFVKRITLYIIYQRIPDDEVPDRVLDDYEETVKYLADVDKGNRSLDLPRKEVVTPEGTKRKTKFRGGSLPKRSY